VADRPTVSRPDLYIGDTFDGSEAHRLGPVDRAFSKAALHNEVTKIAKPMSRKMFAI
jgi:hypothetical protein